jgi:hypothetical protein
VTNQEILTKAIQKAIDGGWNDYNSLESLQLITNTANTVTLKGWVEYVDEGGNSDESQTNITFHYKELIFNHDFAKALWGEDRIEEPVYRLTSVAIPGWHYHLQQMVIADDPIAYLGQNI